MTPTFAPASLPESLCASSGPKRSVCRHVINVSRPNTAMNQGIPAEAFVGRAWAAALALIVIVMVLNIVARVIAKLFAPKTGR